jgi:large subunit ribosomal protein L13
MKTWNPKPGEVEKKWLVLDAQGKPLGRVAAEAAKLLKGKHKPQYANHIDVGDFVIVINADKIKLTGKKLYQKVYYRHSQYPGGLKQTKADKMLREKPERMFRLAVRGMLPRNSLGRKQLSKLKVYAGDQHHHDAQKPVSYAF